MIDRSIEQSVYLRKIYLPKIQVITTDMICLIKVFYCDIIAKRERKKSLDQECVWEPK